MWCIPKITEEFKKRMEDVLDLYEKTYDAKEPVICFDEKSKQLIADTREIQPAKEGKPKRRDYEYKRNGTRNIFVTVEPKGGHREITVTKRRTRADFAKEIQRIVDLPRYAEALKIHIVLDNLNTHFEKSLIETFKKEESERLLAKIQFHHTPKHGSWLNIAENELSSLTRQCVSGRRIADIQTLQEETSAWSTDVNSSQRGVDWQMKIDDARCKLKSVYPNIKL